MASQDTHIESKIEYDIPKFESDSVVDVYDAIANKFSHTRYKPWPTTVDFLNTLETNSKTLEVGCGNGKNLNLRDDVEFHGCDISEGLLDICKDKGFNVLKCDGCNLPYNTNYFDSVYSVAVLHHMSTDERRIKFLSEMVRVTKNDGKIFFQVWATSEPKYEITKDIGELDRMVSFKDNGKVYERYYHFFTKEEVERIIKLYNDSHDNKIEGDITFARNNWIFTGKIKK